ncbi:membrane-spanning 4-domains subfamily A member 4D-like [Sander lucioperca]|uniref:Membrane-spanning 4-domains subfamily A member 4D-like n=1 Tax=Sander lucioperca TaxID=283035 RepID=A0A8C9YCW0_SANLU|nr:membrane-spanning 4-domains subfamily A member 4D-like [Sander lucioperca]XP_031170288.1 membrane-spanning 4-domains subfamily A member 4D-like [Sander lucioperca]
MSAELYCVSEPGGNNASLQSTTVGGSKPLHRFLKGQPKIIGIIMLVMGSSFFTVSIAIIPDYFSSFIWTAIRPGFLMGILFIISGIVYILTEHSPTKKTVTISLALSIVTILGACWTLLGMVPSLRFSHYIDSSHEEMKLSMDLIFLVHSIVGAIIFIVMSCLAGAALRSTKSQAIVVMTTIPAETPVE